MNWRRKLLACFVSILVIVLGFAWPVSAHDPGTTVIEVETTDSGVEVQIDLPIDELGLALGEEVATDALGLSQMREVIVGYIGDQLQVSGVGSEADEADWPFTIAQITVIRSDGREYVRASMSALGDGADDVMIGTTLIVGNDASHEIVVTAIRDDGTALIAGILDAETEELMISFDLEANGSFKAIMLHGFDHVLEGADHLLFLLTLLLPAPLVAGGRRWRSSPNLWPGLKRVIHVATAFTLGHSISLAATALGIISLPSRPVEILIAVSVAVSAMHAIRPLAERGEAPIAAGFGLVHGVAFAEILNNYGLEGGNTLTTLFGFNLGVEAAQLATIAVAFPSLWLLSRTRAYPAVRLGGAGVALAMAVAWVVERLNLGSNPLSFVEDAAIENLLVLGLGVGAVAIIAWALDGRATGPLRLPEVSPR